jgi:stress response protein YsnF
MTKYVPADRAVDQVPGIPTEDDVAIIPVLEEVPAVDKHLALKKVRHVRRRATKGTGEIPVELHEQRADIENISADDDDPHISA